MGKNETLHSFRFLRADSPPSARQHEKSFSSRANLEGLVLASGSGESAGTILKSLASYISSPSEGMPASFDAVAAGNGRVGQNGDTMDSWHSVPVGALPGKTLPKKVRKPGSRS